MVIRKQLRLSGNTEGFERERRCLGILQNLKHENIVELLCSYTYREKNSLLFKCEDMNLDEFLSREDRYKDFSSDIVFYRVSVSLLINHPVVFRNLQAFVGFTMDFTERQDTRWPRVGYRELFSH